jgi:glycosyltransferase involved in cell wall biosynthesis
MFRGFFPEAQLSALFASADIAVVTLAQGFGDTSVPSKILAYMAAGRPVVAAAPAGSETAREVTASRAGIVVPPADGRAMSEAIRRLMDDGVARGRMGDDARARVSAHWNRAAVLSRYLRLFNSMVGEA